MKCSRLASDETTKWFKDTKIIKPLLIWKRLIKRRELYFYAKQFSRRPWDLKEPIQRTSQKD